MDVVKHKTFFSYVSDQETLFSRLKYNQIHVPKTSSQKKPPYYLLKVYYSSISVLSRSTTSFEESSAAVTNVHSVDPNFSLFSMSHSIYLPFMNYRLA